MVVAADNVGNLSGDRTFQDAMIGGVLLNNVQNYTWFDHCGDLLNVLYEMSDVLG
jgi:hypothetical protein